MTSGGRPVRSCWPRRRRSPSGETRCRPSGVSCRWSRSTEDYRFEGPDGQVGLLDLFDGRRQLIIYHFMFHPEWEDGCPSCTAGIDEVSPRLPRAPPHPRHDLRPGLPRTDREARALEGEARLVPALVLVGRRRLQLRLRGHDRRLPRLRRVQLPHARRVRGDGRGDDEDGRAALRHARPELLPRRSTTGCSTRTPCTPAASRAPAAPTTSSTTTALGRQEEWEEPKGRSRVGPHRHPRLRVLSLDRPGRPASPGRLRGADPVEELLDREPRPGIPVVALPNALLTSTCPVIPRRPATRSLARASARECAPAADIGDEGRRAAGGRRWSTRRPSPCASAARSRRARRRSSRCCRRARATRCSSPARTGRRRRRRRSSAPRPWRPALRTTVRRSRPRPSARRSPSCASRRRRSQRLVATVTCGLSTNGYATPPPPGSRCAGRPSILGSRGLTRATMVREGAVARRTIGSARRSARRSRSRRSSSSSTSSSSSRSPSAPTLMAANPTWEGLVRRAARPRRAVVGVGRLRVADERHRPRGGRGPDRDVRAHGGAARRRARRARRPSATTPSLFAGAYARRAHRPHRRCS